MSDYEFKCPECNKITSTHSTGSMPEWDEEVECISCGRISIVQDSLTTLYVKMSCKKNNPSKLDKLKEENLNKVGADE